MKALVLSDYKQLEVVETGRPEPMDDELLIRIAACGICGSDVHGYDGSTGRRIPPIIMGHEAAGIVEAVGGHVSVFRPGDRVTFDSTVFCGKCFYCLRGQVNLCDQREVIRVSTPVFRRMGAFAEYVTVPVRIAYHLPDNLPFMCGEKCSSRMTWERKSRGLSVSMCTTPIFLPQNLKVAPQKE